MCVKLGQILYKRQEMTKKKNKPKTPNCHFWRAGAKTTIGSKSKVLSMPLHSTWPLASPLSSPHRRSQLTLLWEQVRELVACSLCSLRSPQGPSKGLPEFLLWPLVSFYWLDFPGGSGHESACQCRGRRFHPRFRKIPQASESPGSTTTEAVRLGPRLCNRRSHRSERLRTAAREQPPFSETRESPRADMKIAGNPK